MSLPREHPPLALRALDEAEWAGQGLGSASAAPGRLLRERRAAFVVTVDAARS